jgi:hypothetical protein
LKRILVIAAAVVVALIGLAQAARTISMSGRLLVAPIEITGQESAVPILAHRIARGDPLYGPWREPPHMLAIYGPLTYAIPGWIARARDATVWDTWIIGRAVSTVFGVVALVAALVLMARAGVRRTLLPFAALALLPLVNIWSIAFTFRADMAMIACGLVGIAIADDWRGRWKWWSLVFFVAAVAYKQYAVAAPAAVILSLVAEHRIRDALRVVGGLAMAGIAYLLIVQTLTHGWFLANALGAASAAYRLENVTENLRRLALGWPIIAVPGAWVVLRRIVARRLDVVSLYALISLTIAVVLSGRTGSDVNYFVEAYFALAIQAFAGAEGWMRDLETHGWPRGIGGVALAIAALCYIPVDRYPSSPALGLEVASIDAAHERYASALASTAGSPVFPAELSAAVVAGLPTLYSDGFIMDEMIASGRFSADTLLAEFRARGYQYALIPDRVPEAQHVSVVPRVLLRELDEAIDRSSAVKVGDLGAGRSLFLVRLRAAASR